MLEFVNAYCPDGRVPGFTPGIRVKPGVKDPDGRTGTAVWLAGDPGGVTIVDPVTGYLLARENVATNRENGLPAGTATSYDANTFSRVNVLPSWAGHLRIGMKVNPLAPSPNG